MSRWPGYLVGPESCLSVACGQCQDLTPHHYTTTTHTCPPNYGSHDEIGTACACHDQMWPILYTSEVGKKFNAIWLRKMGWSTFGLDFTFLVRVGEKAMLWNSWFWQGPMYWTLEEQVCWAREDRQHRHGLSSLSSKFWNGPSIPPSWISIGFKNMWENKPWFSTRILIIRPLWSTKSCLTNMNFTFAYVLTGSNLDFRSKLKLEKHECCCDCVCGI